MNKTKVNKILITIACFIIVASLSATVFANDSIYGSLTGDGNVNTGKIVDIGNSVISILRAVGMVASVIVLMILGIKYMMGSAEEKAEYKKTFIPYIVGALLLFAAATFAEAIYNFVDGI